MREAGLAEGRGEDRCLDVLGSRAGRVSSGRTDLAGKDRKTKKMWKNCFLEGGRGARGLGGPGLTSASGEREWGMGGAKEKHREGAQEEEVLKGSALRRGAFHSLGGKLKI